MSPQVPHRPTALPRSADATGRAPGPARRPLLLAAAAGAVAAPVVGSAASAHAAPSPGPAERRRRALAVTGAMLSAFRAESDPDMLQERVPRQPEDPEFSYVWPLSQARAAVTELLAGLDAGGPDAGDATVVEEADAALIRAQEHYWYPEGGSTGVPGYTAATNSEQGANGDFFYDDNDWIALLEIEQHLLTDGAAGDLDRAVELLELLRSGEATDPGLPSPGGIWWTQADWNDDRNTVSTVPAAKLALRVHQLTGDAAALEDALRWLDWTRGALLSPEGLFWDNVKLDGTIDRTFWAYNQGVPLATEALAHEITGDRVHRDRALDLVAAIEEHFSPLEEGGPLDEQPLQFTAILLAGMLHAEALLGARVGGRRTVQAVAERLWRTRRDPETDLVTGSRETDVGTHLLDQAGLARILALATLPRRAWRHLS